MNYRPSVLEINANAIRFNLEYFKSKIQIKTQTIAVIKAFGYGSDAVSVAKLIEKDVDYFAVAYGHEGLVLKEAGLKKPIIVFHPQSDNLEAILKNKLEPSIYNTSLLKKLLILAKKQKLTNYPIHIKFNTGLNRLGFSIKHLVKISSLLKDDTSLKISSIFSHLVASEDKNEQDFSRNQIEKFKNIADEFKTHFEFLPLMHMTNTSGILNYPQAHFDMIRIGIGLYGLSNDVDQAQNLKNALTLKSVISQINEIELGESIGYNRALITNKPMKTATIAIGHADGISRKLGNGKGFVSVHGKKAPIVGNVCMDMMMVDVTDIKCKEGDEVILFDSQESIETLAKISGTISYELISAISQRVERKLID